MRFWLPSLAAALLVAACVSGVPPSGASNVPPVMTPATLAATTASTEATPVGRIAFGTFDPAISGFLIYTARPDGSDVRQLLPDGHEIPVWSPDSTKIAVTGGPNGAFATIVGSDGSNPRTLRFADPTLSLGCAAWSPDGKLCAGEGWDDTTPGREGVYLVNMADGSGLRRLTSPTGGIHDIPGSFSPDGGQLAFVHIIDAADGRGELRVIDVDGTGERTIGDRLVSGASYSPDGRSIAAATAHSVLIFDVGDLAAPPKEIVLPSAYVTHSGASWSPDGAQFVLSLFHPGVDRANIYTMKVDGTGLWQVTHSIEESAFGAWGLPPV
jgi:Tol biopolymer transport system component